MTRHRIATIGLSLWQEQIVTPALASLSKRTSVRFVRTVPHARIRHIESPLSARPVANLLHDLCACQTGALP